MAQKAKNDTQKRSTDNQPKIMLENRSLQEIEEEKRTKQEIAHCIELYEEKCYTPPLIGIKGKYSWEIFGEISKSWDYSGK